MQFKEGFKIAGLFLSLFLFLQCDNSYSILVEKQYEGVHCTILYRDAWVYAPQDIQIVMRGKWYQKATYVTEIANDGSPLDYHNYSIRKEGLRVIIQLFGNEQGPEVVIFDMGAFDFE